MPNNRKNKPSRNKKRQSKNFEASCEFCPSCSKNIETSKEISPSVNRNNQSSCDSCSCDEE